MALTQGVDYARAGQGPHLGQRHRGDPVGARRRPAAPATRWRATCRRSTWTPRRGARLRRLDAGSDGVREKDGTKLSLSFLYDSQLGAGGAAAAELAVSEWKEIGIDVTAKQLATNQMAGPLFATGDWDIAWEPIGVDTPDQMVPFLSGATAPDGTNISYIDNADYTAAVDQGDDRDRGGGLPRLARGRGGAVQGGGPGGVRQQPEVPTFAKGTTFTIGAEARRRPASACWRDPASSSHPTLGQSGMTSTPVAVPTRARLSLPGGRWTRFAIRRTGRLLLSLGVVLTASFAMIRLVPGDPVRAALGVDAAPDLVAARRHALGLDTPS